MMVGGMLQLKQKREGSTLDFPQSVCLIPSSDQIPLARPHNSPPY